MARLSPVSREDLIRRPGFLGFEGPYAGSRHQFMIRGTRRLALPNPHRGTIGLDLLARIIREAGVSRDEWESAAR